MTRGNATASLIALPKGGGALSGLGEKFAPDLFTGTANFSLPILALPGRNGFQPELQLTYSSGQGQGWFGLGWSLGLPRIARKTSHGVPRYRDADPFAAEADTFILSGAEDLVAVGTTAAGEVQYRPRTEGLFAEIVHRKGAGPGGSHWRVRSKNGLVSYYGNPESGGSAQTADPLNAARIFAWHPTLTCDPFGNRIEYLYARSRSDAADEAEGRRWDVPVLEQIRYADRGATGALQFLVTVEFEYEARPDPFSEHRAGFEVRHALRCRAIRIRTHFTRSLTVREYRFGYREDDKTRASLLEMVELFGFDAAGNASASMPPLGLTYTRFEPEAPNHRDFFPIRGQELPVASLAEPTLELVDLHGQGLPDILELGVVARYWQNLGNGNFDRPRPLEAVPSGVPLGTPGVRLLDADGDGRMDLFVANDELSGHFPLRAGPTPASPWFRRHARAPTFDLDDPEVRLFDLTGNGVTDALRTGSELECYFNDPEGGFGQSRRIPRQALAQFPNVVFSDPRVFTADMTGDGLTDIALVHQGSVCYWPSLGYGDFGPRRSMRNPPRLPEGFEPTRLLLGDVNGDGLADLVYVGDGHVRLWLNQSGNAWSEPIVVQGTPPVLDGNRVRLVDLLGSGVPGLLWTSNKTTPGRDHYFFLDFTGRAKPYLLCGMDNGIGAITRIAYRPSTQFYVDDNGAGATAWKTSLPFPVQTVARVEVEDALSGGRLVTEYSYHHGYWDGVEREFRGFGRVEQRDSEAFAKRPAETQQSPPLLSKTWFHQGALEEGAADAAAVDRSAEYWAGDVSRLGQAERLRGWLLELDRRLADLPTAARRRARRDAVRSLRGNALRTELYALDGTARQGRPYDVTESLFGFEDRAPPSADPRRPRVFFPQLLARRRTRWERGVDPLTELTFAHRYDDFGQLLAETRVACPRGWRALSDRPSAPYLATRTLTCYATPDPGGPFLHDRVARADTLELTATVGKTVMELAALPDSDASLTSVAQLLSFYDGAAFEGLPLGRVGAYGALSRSEALVLTPERLAEAYGGDVPAYLKPGPVTWPAEYPSAATNSETFRSSLPALAGYVHHDGHDPALPGVVAGLFSVVARSEHDFQANPLAAPRGLVLRRRSALGQDTTLTYAFELLLETVTDAAGLLTQIEWNERFLRPARLTDVNGNQQLFDYHPSGLPSATWVRGKTAAEGDWARPSVMFEYDFFAYRARRQPIGVTTRRFEQHDAPVGSASCLEQREYSDGFGRLLQVRSQGDAQRFGDAVFGFGVLPEDQTASAVALVTAHLASDAARPHVTVSGWQIYDNKGRVVEKYEPFFSEGWDYAAPVDAERGHSVRLFYDPRGVLIRKLYPDDTEELVVHGVPDELHGPLAFEPTPWETYSYDANDNAGRTHGTAALAFRHCWDTPSNVELDALGRTIRAVARNRAHSTAPTAPLAPIEAVTTRFRYDIQGNLVELVDALGRVAMTSVFDLAKRALTTRSLDAGERRVVLNAAGLEIERRDSEGALTLQAHDALERPTRLWARDLATEALTLRVSVTYGDELPAAVDPAARNLRGKPHQQRDGAGLLTFEAYDFKGNLLEETREVVADRAIQDQVDASTAVAPKFVVDWDAPPPLEGRYTTSHSYDALSRTTSVQLPTDEEGDRRVVVPTYNRAGELEALSLGGALILSRVAYDARGQRVLVAHGNGYLTRYAYTRQSARLARLRTERFRLAAGAGAAVSYEPLGAAGAGALQDFGYEHDFCGNLLAIHDRATGSGIENSAAGSNALDRVFEYDALSRLTAATGRESQSLASFPSAQTSSFAAALDRSTFADGKAFGSPGATTAPGLAPHQTSAYREAYTYDPAGNLVELWHKSGARSPWTRHFGMGGLTPSDWLQAVGLHAQSDAPWPNPPNNRLSHASDDPNASAQTHDFDDAGQLLRENGSRHFGWNHANLLAGFSVRSGALAPASVAACYLYDPSGRRVKKWVRRSAQVETTVSIGPWFERHTQGPVANNTLYALHGESRIASRRVGPAFADDGAANLVWQYRFADHLGSSHVVLGVTAGGTNELVNREEFYPYGETSYGGFGKKRFRFTGQERDEESGLQFHGARYYLPWLGRWASCDPLPRWQRNDPGWARLVADLYGYCADNPLASVDSDGTDEKSFYVTLQHPKVQGDPYLSSVDSYGDQQAKQDKNVTHLRVENMDDLVTQLNENLEGSDTVKTITIASHGRSGSILMPLSQADGSNGYQTASSFQSGLSQLDAAKLESLQSKTAGATIELHACETGKDADTMRTLARVLGGKKMTVQAPKIFVYSWKDAKSGKVSLWLDQDLTEGRRVPFRAEEYWTKIEVNDGPLLRTKKEAPDVNLKKAPQTTDYRIDDGDPEYLQRRFYTPRGQPDAGVTRDAGR